MAVIVGRQKMTVRHAGGEHTIFPSVDPQTLPDHLLDHPRVKGGIESGWITVVPAPKPAVVYSFDNVQAAIPEERVQTKRRRN